MSASLNDGVPPEGDRETIVWLARHGEVENPSQIFYARLPRFGLSTVGRGQAVAIRDFLANRPIQAVYTSPMLRARKTASIVQSAHLGIPRRVDRNLLEIRTAWQGANNAELDAIGWNFYDNQRSPSDESLEEIRDRMLRWIHRVVRKHAGAEVVGVSHGDPVLITVGALHGKEMQLQALRPKIYPPTGSVYRLSFGADGTFREARLVVPWQGGFP